MVLTLPVRARPRGETRRAQILDAALTVFLEHGYDRATIDLVVQRASASKATIYSFFGGKEGLFEALVSEYAERILPLDADHVARQFLAVVRSDLHILALSGLLPDDLETAIHKNVQEAVKTFWPALRRKDDEQS